MVGQRWSRFVAVGCAVLVTLSMATPALGLAVTAHPSSAPAAVDSRASSSAQSVDAPRTSLGHRAAAARALADADLPGSRRPALRETLNGTYDGYVGPNRTRAGPFEADREIAAQTQQHAPTVAEELVSADAVLAATAVADAQCVRSELEHRNRSYNASAVDRYLDEATAALDQGDQLRAQNPVAAIAQYERAWGYAQAALDAMDAAVEPQVTITRRQDPLVENASRNYTLQFRVFDVRTHDIDAVTVTVNGRNRTVQLSPVGPRPGTNRTGAVQLSLSERTATIDVVAVDPGQPYRIQRPEESPEETATPTPTQTATSAGTPTSTPSPTPTPTPTTTASPTPTPTPSPTPSPTPTPTPSPTPSPTASPTPSTPATATPTATPVPTSTPDSQSAVLQRFESNRFDKEGPGNGNGNEGGPGNGNGNEGGPGNGDGNGNGNEGGPGNGNNDEDEDEDEEEDEDDGPSIPSDDGHARQTGTAVLRLDGDGLPDRYEQRVTTTDPLDPDSDANTTTVDEANNATLDGLEDFDGDGLSARTELRLGTDPLANDTDGDDLTDRYELLVTDTDPLAVDTDGDGTPDGAEDPDGDGLPNAQEQRIPTDPTEVDGDDDGLDDPTELEMGTDPLDADTDDDGLADGVEPEPPFETDPLVADTDDDGVVDGNETYTTTAGNATLGATVSLQGPGNVAGGVTVSDGETPIAANSSAAEAAVSSFVEITSQRPFESAQVTLAYDESAVPGNESELVLLAFRRGHPGPIVLNTTVQAGNDTVTAEVEQFSTFVAVHRPTYRQARQPGDPWTLNETFENATGWTGDGEFQNGSVLLESGGNDTTETESEPWLGVGNGPKRTGFTGRV